MKRFNLIDGLIILAVLAVLAFGAYKVVGGGRLSLGKEVHECIAKYQIEIADQSEDFADSAFKEGDAVFVGEKERTRGSVVKVDKYPCYKMTINSGAGRYEWQRVPDRFDVILTVTSDSTATHEVIKAGGQTPLKVGEEYVVRGEKAAGLGFMTNLKTSDDDDFWDDFPVYRDYLDKEEVCNAGR